MKQALAVSALIIVAAAVVVPARAADPTAVDPKLAGVAAAAQETAWMTDFAQAKKLAAERKLPILVDFAGSDWCGWCIKLDKEVFSQPAFKTYAAQHVVLFLADFPRQTALPAALKKQNDALAERYGIEGFPTVLLLDASGKELARTGYQAGGAEAYVQHLEALLKTGPAAPARGGAGGETKP